MADVKIQPQNVDAEKAVLGAILIDKDAIVKIAEFLMPEHFYADKHGMIFEVMLELFEGREPIDVVTLPDRLRKKKTLEKVGGVSYISDLINDTPSAGNVESHGKLVRDAYIRRSLIRVASELNDLGFRENDRVENLLDSAEQKLFGISEQHLRGEFVSLRQTLEKSFDVLDELYKNKGQLRGIATGFKSLDSKLSGFRPSNLIIIAARPSVGKSSLLLNMAQFAAVNNNVPIGIFSLEMSSDELAIRMVASQANIDSFKITSGRLSDSELAAYGEAAGILADAPVYIDDTPSLSIMELRTKARRLQSEKGVKMILIDYLQLMRGSNQENRVQEVTEISWGLKALAKELTIPVVAAAQLNRSVEQRGTRVPQLSDLRESGSIEQDADVVIFLYRPDEENHSEVMLTIAKHRNGPTGTIPLHFIGERTRFYEQAKSEDKGG
ncbi:replicative DNA helicase [candidate division WWE3 bacterium RIFCSPLOWO2_01_FULL_39_13]|uniref:Replicative DNA helicase n=1 Tax=candidate division WWE3 bacterium RIFCSPLOWO2_01_FULL_39_13 TaxID=1802624 RepID=A0A1F4V2L0_UNCKA|nr:MAG: replicative DNA helicase [candidate division WWE3 bacterium RIFCSPLOWO2_01_FULL_39_13]